MPRSVFLGRPLPALGEVLWTAEDRQYALALLALEADTCSGCGMSLAESMDPTHEEHWKAEVLKCHACGTAARHVQGWQKSGGDARGAHVRVLKREGASWPTAASTSG